MLGLVNLARRQHIIKIEYTYASEWHRRARHGFEVLGSQAQNAVPALIGVLGQNPSRTSGSDAEDAIDVLGFIGPPAVQAIPSLLRWSDNGDPRIRCDAILALGRIHSDPEKVVPALTNVLGDPDFTVRVYALIALEQFGPAAKAAVPVLVQFHETDTTSRSTSALKAIDPDAAAKAGVK